MAGIVRALFAASTKIDPGSIGITSPVKDANTAFTGILNVAYSAAGIVCVIVIIYGGFIYTTSDGNASNIKRGKDAILGAVIGIVVVIMAFVITQFILGKF
jgi:TRAP-type C4-dicarboxylate transport system permease small subunit